VSQPNIGQKINAWIPIVSLGLAVFAALIVYFEGKGTPMQRLVVVTGYAMLILIFFFGLLVLIAMATNQINLSKLISEPTGDASMSRFQLLIFTFVISLSLFMITIGHKDAKDNDAPEFPNIPNQILTLLGISATTYGVSKGIQFSQPEGLKPDPEPDPHPPVEPVVAAPVVAAPVVPPAPGPHV
jgi:hypothetical protein